MRKTLKSTILLLGCSLFTLTLIFPQSVNHTNARFSRVRTTQMRPTAQCIPQTQLSKSLDTLRLNLSGEDLFKARQLLLENAKSSQDCRSQVVQAVMTALKQPGKDNGLGGVDSETYALWHNGAELLGELRATEALDLLIANFGLTDGLSATLGHFPALAPIIAMGQPSIPKLQEIIDKNPEPFRRKFAVFCLASIGGTTAKRVLASALPGESDPCVKKFIGVTLEVFDNKTKPNHITADENGRWYSYVYCS
jgi:hypothetical protein